MKNQVFKVIILSLLLVALSGCVTIICNSEKHQEHSEVFTDEATKNQAEKINNDGGLL
jgi:uncharacterized protein YceK